MHLLVAANAAGEGIYLQRTHLLANYDLPWKPNRIEQRFGRISTLTEPALIIVDENDSSIFAVEDIESWNSEIGVERINDVGAHGTDYLHSERKRDAFIKAVLRFLQR